MLFGNKIYHKLLLAIILPVILLFVSFFVFLHVMIAPHLEQLTLDKMEAVGQQRMFQVESIYEQIYQTTWGILSDSTVQNILLTGEISSRQESMIKSLLRSYCYSNVYNITYLTADRKQMVSGLFNDVLTKQDFEELTWTPQLEESYSRSVWVYQGENSPSARMLVVQRLRHPSIDAEPGFLVYQLSARCMDQVLETKLNRKEIVAVLDQEGQVIVGDELKTGAQDMIAQIPTSADIVAEEFFTPTGRYLVSSFSDQGTDWAVVSYLSYEDAMEQYKALQQLMIAITLLLVICSVGVALAVTRLYTKPIHTIVQAMESFRHNRFQMRISSRLPDEFGEIGATFNLMVGKIETLIQDLKQNQEKLRAAELNSLMYQINPHFIYNTLNNIYMLARMSGQTQIAQLLDALSKFLRSTLSKGNSVVPLKDEITHVSSYLNIQKIRYGSLFDFSVEEDPDLSLTPVLKFILQPMVENSINHGFLSMDSGGKILIRVFQREDKMCLTVEDNGTGMPEGILSRLNQISRLSIGELSSLFPESQGGYGVGNVIARLKLCYGDSYEIHFSNLHPGAKCEILLPKRKDEV